MNRLIAIICALMLVLSFGTGPAAHAEQRLDCTPASLQSVGDYVGEREESPSESERSEAHNHSSCGGHHFGAPSETDKLALTGGIGSLASNSADRFDSGNGPDNQLRPPIA